MTFTGKDPGRASGSASRPGCSSGRAGRAAPRCRRRLRAPPADDGAALRHGLPLAGIGSLDPGPREALFLRVGALTLVLWALALGAVFLMPLAFPAIESASFFSTTLVEERRAVDFVALYIPSNPFHSLANNVVPAVVLFSALLGVALMGVDGKERLLESLGVLERGARPRQPAGRPPHAPRALRHRRPRAGTLDLRAGRPPARLPARLRGHGAAARALGLPRPGGAA